MKNFGSLLICILALSLIPTCLGKVVPKTSSQAHHKEKGSSINQPSKQSYQDRKDNNAIARNSISDYASELQRRLDYTSPISDEDVMDVKHGVFNGDLPIVTSSETESVETYVRGQRQATPAKDDEDTCLHDLQPCRRHKQCCGGYCNWGIGMKCLS